MSRPDRTTYRATDLEGRVLPGNARLMLRFLWDHVRKEAATQDREGGPAPIVPITKLELQEGLEFGATSVDDHLRTLHNSWWARRHSQRRDLHYIQLLNPERRVAALDAIGTSTANSPGERKRFETSITGPPNTEYKVGPGNPGRSSRILGHGSRESGEIFPDSRDPRIVNSLKRDVQGLTGCNLVNPPDRAREAEGGVNDHFIALATEILSEAIPPPLPAAQIPATRHGARFLAARLAEGWPEMAARRLLARAPTIIARGLRDARFYSAAGLFEGERHDHWLTADAALEAIERNEAMQAAEQEEFERRQREHVEQLTAEASTVVPDVAVEDGGNKYDVMGRLAQAFLANRFGATEGDA